MTLSAARYCFFLFACCSLLPNASRAQAQATWRTWYFGQRAGLRFSSDSVAVLTNSQMSSGAASASVSDANGSLLFYSNGEKAWNRQHQLMANGDSLAGFQGTAQGCAIVPNPQRAGWYYLFTNDSGLFSAPNRKGLRVSEVDLSQAGGLGQVVNKNQPVLPDTLLQRLGRRPLMEQLALIRHANGRDYWVVVHLLDSNAFLSVQVTGSGVARSSIVVSTVGAVHQLQGSSSSIFDAPGYMTASSDGQRLVFNSHILGAELFHFDPGTGRVSNPVRLLRSGVYSYGAAFSPDNNLVYIARQGPNLGSNGCPGANAISDITQYDLRAANIGNSGIVIANTCSQIWGIQKAPNGLIYVANPGYGSLDCIRQPNVRGAGCQYSASALNLRGRLVYRGFPVVPNDSPLLRSLVFAAAAQTACVGQSVAFALSPSVVLQAGDTLAWAFGDASTLRTTTPMSAHAYALPGTYQVVVQLRNRSLLAETRQIISVFARPAVALGPDRVLCTGTTFSLSAGAQSVGTSFRWQDGATTAGYSVSRPGLYWLDVISPQGCTTRDSLLVSGLDAPAASLGTPEQTICVKQILTLSPGPQPAGTSYRWQDGSTAPAFSATAPGLYRVTITVPNGCTSTAEVVIRYGAECLVTLPNIITPNADRLNDAFAPEGLLPGSWALEVYNRWGQKVYTTTDYRNDWGPSASAGSYYYLLHQTGTAKSYKGWLEVVR